MWVTDYGNPEIEDDFRHLLAYSPVHNVRLPDGNGAQHPAIMLSFAVSPRFRCNNQGCCGTLHAYCHPSNIECFST